MGTVETQLAVQVALLLVKKLFESGIDTSELEMKIAEAKTADDVKAVLMDEAKKHIADKVGTVAQDAPIIAELADAATSQDVRAAITKPGAVEAILAAVGNLLALLFGGW